MNISDLKGKTVALASSGGLDSCTVTCWLKEHGVEVVSMTADLGQPDEIDINEIKERMFSCGAKDAVLLDIKKEISEVGFQMIQARATYEGGYWNTTGIARHVTCEALAKEMKKRGINILVHGATGRGNDQVRFSLATHMVDPEIEVYAPWRDDAFINAFGGRKEMIEYCNEKGISIKASLEKPYSTDSNILGLTHEAGKLEYLDTPASFVEPVMGVLPRDAEESGEEFKVTFSGGVPTSINGVELDPVKVFEEVNKIGGRNAIGISIHAVENRFVGIKSRGIYESPALVLLSACYEFILEQVLDRKGRNLYEYLSREISEQIYQGYFFDLKTRMMLKSLEPLNKMVSGTVTVDLYKGNIAYLSSQDVKYSLYDPELSSMEDVGDFDHKDSEGFIRVLGVNAKALKAKGQLD